MKSKSTQASSRDLNTVLNYFCLALLIGTIWGFFEVLFKDVLNMGGTPFASAIMTGIGVFLMAVGYSLFKKSHIFLTIAVFAGLARMIIVPVLGCSPMCRANSVLALLLLGASITLASGVFSKAMRSAGRTGGLIAGSGALLSGVSYYFAGLACAPCRYLLNFASAGGVTSFVASEVMYWALFSAIMFYPGYAAGMLIRDAINSLREERPVPYYSCVLSASIVMILVTGFAVLP